MCLRDSGDSFLRMIRPRLDLAESLLEDRYSRRLNISLLPDELNDHGDNGVH